MDRLRHLIETGTETASPEMARFNSRPGELFAAGAVGGRQLAVPQREDALERVDSDIGRLQRPRQATPVRLRMQNQPGQRSPGSTSPTREPDRAPASDRITRATIRTALRTPASLRLAIILREVLDPPVALRDERHGR